MADRYRCRCDQCCPGPLPTWTRAHLDQCEARFVAGLAPGRRNQYLDEVIAKRGLDAAVVLKQRIATLPVEGGR